MEKTEAIERIQRQINQIDHLKTIDRKSPNFKKWKRNTEVLIENVFGQSNRHKKDFNSIKYSLGIYKIGTSDYEFQRAYVRGLENVKAILESFIEEITEYWTNDSMKKKESKKKESEIIIIPKIDSIWQNIKINFDIDKRTFGKKINFISDSFRRKILFRDIANSYYLANNGFPKSAVILAGGVIEELLRHFLIHKGINVKNKKFDDYIKTCVEKKYLKSGISKLTDSVRHFRNIVHLELENDKKYTISKASAIGAVSSIFTIVNDF